MRVTKTMIIRVPQRSSCKVCGYSFINTSDPERRRCNTCLLNGYQTSTERRQAVRNGTHKSREQFKRSITREFEENGL
jgi:hypothetical protein